MSCLEWTVFYGREKTALLLLEHGADFNYVNQKGKSILHLACQRQLISVIQKIISLVNVNCVDNEEANCLHDLFTKPQDKTDIKNQFTILNLLLEHGIDVNNQKKYDKRGVLHTLISNYHSNYCNFLGENGFLDIFKTLVEHHVNLTLQDKDGNSFLHYVASLNTTLTYDFLDYTLAHFPNLELKNQDKRTILEHALYSGEDCIARRCIKAGAHIKTVWDGFNDLPLMMAVNNFCYDSVTLILSKLSSEEINQLYYSKPLFHYAFDKNDIDMAELLLKNGVKISTQDKEGQTALDMNPKYKEKYQVFLEKELLEQSLKTQENTKKIKKI